MVKFFSRMIVLGSTLVLLNLMTFMVLEFNLSAEVYPTDADSVGIPIAGTLIFSFISFLGVLPVCFFSGVSLLKAPASGRRFFLLGSFGLVYLLNILWFVFFGSYWLDPHHLPIVAICSFAIGALVFFAGQDFRRLVREEAG